ncbi:MAG: hypothetical protein CM1200mP2_33450 [Planctomycetaceae bacterium]|nr:MAG: hypothetical protein CM1200mP2_33450 [Planctomycetaceae bacterium]
MSEASSGCSFLFSWSGSQTQDWQTLIVSLGRDNAHRRGRAFHDLAQLLNSGKTTETGTPLGQHPPLATALSDLASRTPGREKPAPEEAADHLQQVVLLVRLLGLLDVPDATLPVLDQSLSDGQDPAVRQAGLQALASVGKRAIDREAPIDESSLVSRIDGILSGKEPDLRRDATVALGTFSSETAVDRLDSLLDDSDEIVRYNAAVSLVRRGRMQGLSVFRDTIRMATEDRESLDLSKPDSKSEIEAFEQRWLLLQLTLKAIGNLSDSLPDSERTSLVKAVTPLAGDDTPARIRIDAKRVLQRLER